MPNVWSQFRALLPDTPLHIGTIAVRHTDGSATVELLDGGLVRVHGTGSIGARVFVRNGRIETIAPQLAARADEREFEAKLVGERNVLAGGGGYGEEGFPIGTQLGLSYAHDTRIEGNYVGTTPDGLAKHPGQSGTVGIAVGLGSLGTVVHDNVVAGILMVGTNHYQGQRFGTGTALIPIELCKRAIADSGIDLTRPLLVQVSRFDPWKDPLGVIQAYRMVKEAIPGVQLALIGGMAGDDPEGWHILEQIEEEAANDRDLYVFTNLAGVGSMEVNVFQRGCDLIIQKSIREGFGLVVSEALWKEKPVIAGRAGGIPMQFPEGYHRYLVDTVEECADRVLHLLKRPGERGDFGRAGREHVRKHFLFPRLLRDELRLIRDLLRPG